MPIHLTHDAAGGRFVARVDDVEAANSYSIDDGAMTIAHTHVPESISGRGIAGALTAAALEYARARRLAVVAKCAYVAAYIDKHPEYASLVAR